MANERRADSVGPFDFADVDITDDFMFSTVMQDASLCMELLNYLLPECRISKLRYIRFDEEGNEITEPEYDGARSETQKSFNAWYGFRGVRLDAYVEDSEAIYSIEMQTTKDRALPQRSRLYQSHIDTAQLRRGEHYDQLRPCYVIFICKFDPFSRDCYRYSFRNRCDEDESLTLNDGAYKLFFNTTGHKGDIPARLRELLEYMNDAKGYPVARSDNALIHRIEAAVSMAKLSGKWRDSYMVFQIKQREAHLQGREEGIGIGREEGIGIGREEGIGIGRKEERAEMVRKMHMNGVSVNQIAEMCGIPSAEIESMLTQKDVRKS